MHTYEPVSTPRDGRRLHLNENTAGCSPAVLAALQALPREHAGTYPDYAAARAAAAAHLRVGPEELLLTNGLDEGIVGLTAAALRGHAGAETIVLVPAFDMYAAAADGLGARVVQVPLGEEFAFPLDRLLAAITPRTRLVWLTNPNNPSGGVIPRETILAVADAAAHAIVAVDEAYVDFGGESMIDEVSGRARSNLVVGRTFSKAFGLAGLRVGALVGPPPIIASVRRIVPPYSVNGYAAAALPAALADLGYYHWYLEQVRESRRLLAAAFDRLGVVHWPSAGNFLLVRPGGDCPAIVRALAARGVHVRDKSADAHCPGCLRVTAGLVSDSEAFVAAFEDVVCGAA
jgi:histidinol-phosphate aminotransferase